MTRILSLAVVAIATFAGLVGTTNTATAAPVGGGKRTVEVVESKKTDVYRAELYGQEKTRVQVAAKETSLTLRVYNQAGELLTTMTVPAGDQETFYITPGRTSTFRFEIANPHGFAVRYAMILD